MRVGHDASVISSCSNEEGLVWRMGLVEDGAETQNRQVLSVTPRTLESERRPLNRRWDRLDRASLIKTTREPDVMGEVITKQPIIASFIVPST